jgi:hypothetical protein
MIMGRQTTYAILLLICAVGYGWVGLNLFDESVRHSDSTSVCLFKHTTGLPCPSCGSTRAVVAIAEGNIVQSLTWNPIGILIAFIMLIAPFWILYDLVTSRITLLQFYHWSSGQLRRKWLAIPAIILILCNWAWNISKGL